MAKKTMHMSELRHAILGFVEVFWQKKGYAPTLREIGAAVGRRSTSVIRFNVAALVKAGYLTQTPGITRTIKRTEKA